MAETSYGAPKLDNLSTKRQLHEMFIQNVVQQLLHKNGRGISDEYVPNVKTDEIRVIRLKGTTAGFRTLGASGTNTASINAKDPAQPVSEEYGLRLRNVFDQAYVIAKVQWDMLPMDIIGGQSKVIEQRVSKLINAYTIALQMQTVLNADSGESDNIYRLGASEGLLSGFIQANAILDDGDPDNGQDTFEIQNRLAIMRSSAIATLKTSEGAVFDMNNVTAQELLRLGELSTTTETVNTRVDGYRGDIDAVPVAMASNDIWKIAEVLLGVTEGDLNGVYAIISASEATQRGIDFGGVEVGQHPYAQGIVLKPLFRWGAEVFFPKGIVLLAANDFVNPAGTATGTDYSALELTAVDNSI
jgi:hypothetical protein